MNFEAMSRDKSSWFGEEVLLDAALVNNKLELRELKHLADLLRDEACLNRDPDTGRLRPKKASEYTLRFIAQILHIMRRDLVQRPYDSEVLAVAEQCLRLIRSCAAYGMKIQTYICKDLRILEDMLAIFDEYQHLSVETMNEDDVKNFDSCMVALTQTLGNLVVNNPFNQTIIWERFGTNILNALIGQNEKIASCAAMIVYNILLGQPNVLPDDVLLLNALAYMYTDGNSEFPHLIIEYLIGVENSYIEKLYSRLEPDTKILILNLAYDILMCIETQDINVSVNFIKFIAHEFKVKSDCILKTVDKYVNTIEPQEVVFLLDIVATASSMDAYMDCLQSDVSLFINCAFLLRSIHKLGKQENNFFTGIHKLYNAAGKTVPENTSDTLNSDDGNSQNHNDKGSTGSQDSVKKCDSTDMLQCNETISECTESESSEQYYECNEQLSYTDKEQSGTVETVAPQSYSETKVPDSTVPNSVTVPAEKFSSIPFPKQSASERKPSDACKIDENFIKVAFAKNIIPDLNDTLTDQNVNQSSMQSNESLDNVTLEHNSSDDMEPPLITDSPEEGGKVEQKHSEISRKVSVDVNVPQIRKDSTTVQNIINTVILNKEPIQPMMSRQQSVEPAIEASEVVLREMTANIPQSVSPNQNPIDPQNVTVEQPNPPQSVEVVQPKAEPAPVKKAQGLSSEFDLSEQLQKILGISSDKAVRSESVELPKEPHVQISHPKLEHQTSIQQSLPTPPISSIPNAENIQPSFPNPKPKIQMKIPNVKIDSPESNQRSKLGNFEHTGPKKLASVVESVEQHVAFGFKATLIRTVGNLCWKNQINKRKVRELELIPLLLDCCNIDKRNPLIMQWVILAVRNLCENCPENQEIIASMSLQEPVSNQFLNEMGITINTDSQNNKIKLAPLLKK
ncbi:uncharacterized protein LOC143912170 isoform X2 [Arctopsyche grandis]|uniref:uncharacterized protein LOC143912170 isoform X2 n=1 Tax=Arctopsyche grandis TaxID=121162 RepID=UPI00406D9BFA